MGQDKTTSAETFTRLREHLCQCFNLEELSILCNDIGLDPENVPGETKPAKVAGLIAHIDRRGGIDKLVEQCNKQRPNVNWASLVAIPPVQPLPPPEVVVKRQVSLPAWLVLTAALVSAILLSALLFEILAGVWSLSLLASALITAGAASESISIFLWRWRWKGKRLIPAASLFSILLIAGIVWAVFTPSVFVGKVCMIKSDWDTNTMFLRRREFDALGLPIGTKVTVIARSSSKVVRGVPISLGSMEICSVRLSDWLRQALDVDNDVTIQPESNRPDRPFDVVLPFRPTSKQAFSLRGKVCMRKETQDSETIFLRKEEFGALGVPAGTTVIVTVVDTGKTIGEITLGLDDEIAICTVRLSKSIGDALGVGEDMKIEPESKRPDRQFSIQLPQPAQDASR